MQQALNPRHKRIFAVKDGAPSSAQVPIRKPPNVSYFGKSDTEDREIQSQIVSHMSSVFCSGPSAGISNSDSKKDDLTLVTAMASRLRAAEAQLKSLREDCKIKDRLIYDLQKSLTELNSESDLRDRPRTAPSQDHPQRCNGDLVLMKEANARLRLQLEEMHQFLADYGLKWVGCDDKKLIPEPQSVKQLSQGPEALGFELNMQKIIAHAKELNSLTGQKRLAKHGHIRQYENLPEVCITFYNDGLLVRNGPARAYAMKESRLLVRDLIDGYFPFEFKADFPDGIKLVIIDKLNESCVQVQKTTFEGIGHHLDSALSIHPSAQKDPDTSADLAGIRALRARHGGVAPQHLQNFLQKLPQSVIVGGDVVSVRTEITDLMKNPGISSIFTESEPSILLKNRSDNIENDVKNLVDDAKKMTSSQESKTSNAQLTEHTLVVRQPGGEALPKMSLPSDTTVGDL
jgi:hypothetical protein